ncbi:MAG: hypothetical protein AB2705_16550, partial [Candidatus Thiodiazotropha sp.]
LRPPNIKTTSLLRLVFPSPKWYFLYGITFDIKTTSLIRPHLGSPKGGLNIGILLYFASHSIFICCYLTVLDSTFAEWRDKTIFMAENSLVLQGKPVTIFTRPY